MKTCRKCDQEKDDSCFRKTGWSICYPCRNLIQKARYAKLTPEERHARRQRRYARELEAVGKKPREIGKCPSCGVAVEPGARRRCKPCTTAAVKVSRARMQARMTPEMRREHLQKKRDREAAKRAAKLTAIKENEHGQERDVSSAFDGELRCLQKCE